MLTKQDLDLFKNALPGFDRADFAELMRRLNSPEAAEKKLISFHHAVNKLTLTPECRRLLSDLQEVPKSGAVKIARQLRELGRGEESPSWPDSIALSRSVGVSQGNDAIAIRL